MKPSSCLNEPSCSSSTTISRSFANGRNRAERAPTTIRQPPVATAVPDLAAHGRGDVRMPFGRRDAEPLGEAGDHRLGQGDLRQQDQDLGVGIAGAAAAATASR